MRYIPRLSSLIALPLFATAPVFLGAIGGVAAGFTPSVAHASQSDETAHVVVNVVNGLVYVNLGSADGASVGSRVDVLGAGGDVIGVLRLDLCGEVLCRAKLPPELADKIVTGLRVQFHGGKSKPSAPPAPTPNIAPAPVVPPTNAPPASAPVPPPTAPAATEIVRPIDETFDDTLEPPPPMPAPKKAKPTPALPPQSGGYVPDPMDSLEKPLRLPYRSGQAVPSGYVVARRRSDGLVKTGWVIFGIGYGVSLLCALGDSDYGLVLALPVAGPFIYAATPEKRVSSGTYSYPQRKEIGDGVSVTLGITQVVGAGLLALGYHGVRELRRKDAPVSVIPVLSAQFAGLSAVGTF